MMATRPYISVQIVLAVLLTRKIGFQDEFLDETERMQECMHRTLSDDVDIDIYTERHIPMLKEAHSVARDFHS